MRDVKNQQEFLEPEVLYKDLAKDMRTWRERHEDRARDIQDSGTIHEDLG